MAVPATAFKLIDDGGDVSLAETWYAEAVRLDGAGSATAVDAYLQCAVAAWPAVESLSAPLLVGPSTGGSPIPAEVQDSREWKLYHSAVVGLITSAQKWGRWSPQTGLLAMGPQGLAPLETAYHGFTWAPTEFGSLQCVGAYQAPQPEGIHRRDGVGVPLVVVRSQVGPQRPFVQTRSTIRRHGLGSTRVDGDRTGGAARVLQSAARGAAGVGRRPAPAGGRFHSADCVRRHQSASGVAGTLPSPSRRRNR